jgi:hypothetical protein
MQFDHLKRRDFITLLGEVEKGAASGGQFDPVHAAAHQLNADLIFEIADDD